MSRMRRSRANNIGMHIITIRQTTSSQGKSVRKTPRSKLIAPDNPYGAAQRAAARLELGKIVPRRKKLPTQPRAPQRLGEEQRENKKPAYQRKKRDLPAPKIHEDLISADKYEAQVRPETRERWDENRRRVEAREQRQCAQQKEEEL